jgi:hypothetical protein
MDNVLDQIRYPAFQSGFKITQEDEQLILNDIRTQIGVIPYSDEMVRQLIQCDDIELREYWVRFSQDLVLFTAKLHQKAVDKKLSIFYARQHPRL